MYLIPPINCAVVAEMSLLNVMVLVGATGVLPLMISLREDSVLNSLVWIRIFRYLI